MLLYALVFDVRQLADTRRPDEKCKDVLAADPTLVLAIGLDPPLACAWDHLLVTDVSTNDAPSHVEGARVDDLIHALRVDDRLKLEACA